MVGTAYRRARPGAPFVEVGSRVAPGDTLCYRRGDEDHEPDRTGRAGTVIQILIEDGQPVEFGSR